MSKIQKNDELQYLENSIEGGSKWNDFHANYTIVFGSLIKSDYDWGRNDYYPKWDSNNPRREKLNSLIEDYFFFREISTTPFLKWKMALKTNLNLILPKYDLILDLLDEDINIFQTRKTNYKERKLYSEFPQSQLSGDNDYATNSDDTERIEEEYGDIINKITEIYDKIESVYKKIIEDIEGLFMSIISSEF